MAERKRRPRGEGSIHQRPNGTWAAQLDLGYVDGKRKRVAVYAKTYEGVRKQLGQLKRRVEEHGDLPTSDMTIEKWLTYWLEEIAYSRVKPSTFRSYKTTVTQHIVPSLGKVKLGNLSARHVRQMHRDIIDRGRTRSATLAHRVLSVALNDAVRDGAAPRNVVATVHAPAVNVAVRKALDAEQAVKLLTTVPDVRWLFALLTGCRQGERLGLRWSHLNLDGDASADLAWTLQRIYYAHGCNGSCGRRPASCPQRRLPIPDGMEHENLTGNFVLLRPKTKGSTRMVALIDPLRDALLALREKSAPSPYDLVWTEKGKPVPPRQDWQDWHDALKAAGLPKITQHGTRHTTGTLLLELGVPEKVRMEIMGHSTVAVAQGYQHVSLGLQRKALEGLGERLELG